MVAVGAQREIRVADHLLGVVAGMMMVMGLVEHVHVDVLALVVVVGDVRGVGVGIAETADEETLDSWYRIEEYTRLSKANGLAKGKSDAELEMKWNWQEDDFSPDGDQDEVEGQCESQDEDRVFEEFWVGVSKGSGE